MGVVGARPLVSGRGCGARASSSAPAARGLTGAGTAAGLLLAAGHREGPAGEGGGAMR